MLIILNLLLPIFQIKYWFFWFVKVFGNKVEEHHSHHLLPIRGFVLLA